MAKLDTFLNNYVRVYIIASTPQEALDIAKNINQNNFEDYEIILLTTGEKLLGMEHSYIDWIEDEIELIDQIDENDFRFIVNGVFKHQGGITDEVGYR